MLPKVFFFFFFWGGGGGGGGGGGEASLVPTDSTQVPRGRGGGEMGKILAKYSSGQMLPFASSPSHSIHGFYQSGAHQET